MRGLAARRGGDLAEVDEPTAAPTRSSGRSAVQDAARLAGLIDAKTAERDPLRAELAEILTERETAVLAGEEPPDRSADRRRIADALDQVDEDLAALEVALAAANAQAETDRQHAEYAAALADYHTVTADLSPDVFLRELAAAINATGAAGDRLRSAAGRLMQHQAAAQAAHHRLVNAAIAAGESGVREPQNAVETAIRGWYAAHRLPLAGVVLDPQTSRDRVLTALAAAAAQIR